MMGFGLDVHVAQVVIPDDVAPRDLVPAVFVFFASQGLIAVRRFIRKALSARINPDGDHSAALMDLLPGECHDTSIEMRRVDTLDALAREKSHVQCHPAVR